MYFYFTYSIKTKILSVLGTEYFLKILKINSQQEKQIYPNRKKLIPAKHKKLPIHEKKNFVPHGKSFSLNYYQCCGIVVY